MILTYNHIDEDCSSNGEMAFDLEHQGQGQILFWLITLKLHDIAA